MPKPIRSRYAVNGTDYWIETTDDGSRTIIVVNGFRGAGIQSDTELAYHSGCGAAAECDQVYIRNSGFSGPLSQWPRAVLEIGFGTGLAMLRTVDTVLSAGHALQYVALENSPLPVGVIRELRLGEGLSRPHLADEYLKWWDSIHDRLVDRLDNVLTDGVAGGHTREATWQIDDDHTVRVIFGDALKILPMVRQTFDAVYFDPFDPQASPELWTEAVFRQLHRCLRVGGTLVTYCVKVKIRRALESAGFEVARVPGPPGGKREVLIARAVGVTSGS